MGLVPLHTEGLTSVSVRCSVQPPFSSPVFIGISEDLGVVLTLRPLISYHKVSLTYYIRSNFAAVMKELKIEM